eukprot:scaffold1142_cov210-Alexandrium_tamarense.AAC.2
MIRRSLLLVLAVAKTPALSSANLLTSSRRHNHGDGNSQDDGGEVCHDPFGSDCAEGYYCKMNIGECLKEDEEMVGSCTEVFGGCTRMYRQVCGCDGVTYANSSCAGARGVNVREEQCSSAVKDCSSGAR